ncbi:hypothetical protein ASPTUDRAFT_51550 [Aspergillus tubingensis CBS 134.48]|uniref:Cyanovirin-N domain-containing protein n=1 Tax=Aspergillus tubingensis (strain CBS 134.48) TaxID=767770 RepID=A0A1L9NF36_ASPTC|nr:hypothetical protein ASPTUDRAFT_51550 [Aspergillus tubingensis CBS 134.48]
MKLTAIITAAALAFAASASAATCTPGLDYCSDVLLDVDPSNSNAISQTLQNSGGGSYANDQYSWYSLIFHCNNDHSLTWRECGYDELCANQGSGRNDICVNAPIF